MRPIIGEIKRKDVRRNMFPILLGAIAGAAAAAGVLASVLSHEQ